MLIDAPWAFFGTPEDDFAIDEDRVRELLASAESEIVAAEADVPSADTAARVREELVAAAGIRRQKPPKFGHRAFLWGVFVDPAYRRRGLARRVVSSAIDLARSWQGVEYVSLGVSENSAGARQLYESLGFQAWGREPAFLEHDGRRYDEFHMLLRL